VLVFFATPHQGGNGASLGDVVAKIVNAAPGKPNNDLLDALKKNSIKARERFEQARHVFEKCLVVSFYEGKPYGSIGIVCTIYLRISKRVLSLTLVRSSIRYLQL
jgi:hypothetical protein